MSVFVFICSVAVAFLLFLQIIRLKENVTHTFGAKLKKNQDLSKGHTNYFELASSRRTCPICKTSLQRNEFLYCAMSPEAKHSKHHEQVRQVQIYGCRYCYAKFPKNSTS